MTRTPSLLRMRCSLLLLLLLTQACFAIVALPRLARVGQRRGLRTRGQRTRGQRTHGQHERVRSYWRKDEASPLASRLEAMIRATPALARPVYSPTVRASKINFALATLRSRLGAIRRKVEPPLSGRISPTADPDVVVEWCKDEVGASLPPDAPICIFLHTITGSAAQTRWLMSEASRRGWRSCVFVRRGHAAPQLKAPSFNLLGCVEDVDLQLAVVRSAYPDASFLGMVGVSAGELTVLSASARCARPSPRIPAPTMPGQPHAHLSLPSQARVCSYLTLAREASTPLSARRVPSAPPGTLVLRLGGWVHPSRWLSAPCCDRSKGSLSRAMSGDRGRGPEPMLPFVRDPVWIPHRGSHTADPTPRIPHRGSHTADPTPRIPCIPYLGHLHSNTCTPTHALQHLHSNPPSPSQGPAAVG